jgi:hypothetical protein
MADKSKHSLVSLTQDFVNLLTNANGEEVDLNTAGETLGASKRRIYDVTNVLAGIGLIKRCGKARVRWIGNDSGADEASDVKQLMRKESDLDRMTAAIDESLARLAASQEFQEFAWVSEEDAMKLGDTELTLFPLRGPSGLQIEVPEDDEPTKHRIICTSQAGNIELIPIHTGPK